MASVERPGNYVVSGGHPGNNKRKATGLNDRRFVPRVNEVSIWYFIWNFKRDLVPFGPPKVKVLCIRDVSQSLNTSDSEMIS